ncbi:MAG: IPT/TIG domain-containing protein [Acidobacteria bacterium]|nr:IPT/TIG domain-containing protein [Acidobacteriota bacterium]
MHGRSRRFGISMFLLALLIATFAFGRTGVRMSAAQPAVVVLSAASFDENSITPSGIVAAFGSGLATTTAIPTTAPLPVELGGTTARIRDSANVERAAELFFVSPNQVNLLVPAATAEGEATITIRSGDGAVSTGGFNVVNVAPSIFTANSNGAGVPAANLIRVRSDGSQVLESPFEFGAGNTLQPRPIDLGPEGDRVFLILFLSGIRFAADPNGDGNLNESIGVVIAGGAETSAFAGEQGSFSGLDQVNLELPRVLAGRGRINLAVTAGGFASNPVEIEFASSGAGQVAVSSFSPAMVLAGETLGIDGSGFDPDGAGNLVRVGGVEAAVNSASETHLDVTVPFGASSGAVTVATVQGESASDDPINVRTSISGLIESTDRQPLPGVAVRIRGTDISDTTSLDGSFLLPDAATGAVLVEIDATTVKTTPAYDKVLLKMPVTAGRDNPYPTAVAMQQATGASVTVGNANGFGSGGRVYQHHSSSPGGSIQTGGIRFDIADNAAAIFADGARQGVITLSVIVNNRTPAPLPPGHTGTSIAQLSPAGVQLSPGGTLSFPNTELLPPNSTATLFKLDQNPASRTVGSFVAVGSATVTSNGLRIESDSGAITESGIYFASVKQQTTTVVGRVFDSDGRTPVRFAHVRARNRESFTDGNGGFILRNVPVRPGAEQLIIEASFVRPNRRVDRVFRAGVIPVLNGTTVVQPELVLPSATSNRPPVLLAPNQVTVVRGETSEFNIVAVDPDSDPVTIVAVTGAPFAAIQAHPESPNVFQLVLSPGSGVVPGDYTLTLRAFDNRNAVVTQTVVVQVVSSQ